MKTLQTFKGEGETKAWGTGYDVLVFSALMTVFAICYMPILTFFPLGMDSEIAALRTDATPWITQGRWLNYAVEAFLFPYSVTVYFPFFVFGMCLAGSYMLLVRALRMEVADWKNYVLFPLFACFPTWIFMAEFPSNLPSVGFGALLASGALYVVADMLEGNWWQNATWKERLQKTALVCGMCTPALGAYQSFVFFFIVGGLFYLIINFGKAATLRIVWPKLGLLAVMTVLSVVAYYIIWKLAMAVTGTEPAYVQQFVEPMKTVLRPDLVIINILKEFQRFYFGGYRIYGVTAWGLAALMLSGMAIAFQHIKANYVLKKTWIFVFVVALFAPFGMTLLSGGSMPFRSLMALPLAVWVCAHMALAWSAGCWRKANYVFAVIACVQLLYTMSMFQSAKHLASEHDKLLAVQIYERIAETAEPFDTSKPQKIDIYGGVPFATVYPTAKHSVAQASFFGWDGGYIRRIIPYMTLRGYTNFELLPLEQRLALIPEYGTMPVWPALGSVKKVGDVILVKLSNKPGLYQ